MPLTTLAVCVATYRRPEGLRSLLGALAGQLPTPGCDWHIVVVDNDAAASAAAIVREFEPLLAREIHYAVEPQRGVARARNRSVQCAGSVDWIAFIDDDEVPSPNWLASLLASQRRFGADIVNGPVVARFEPGGPSWVRALPHFRSPVLPTGTPLAEATTSNTLVARRLLGDAPFDAVHFNARGEDTDCFLRLAQDGATIVWSAEEPVVTTVPLDRQSLGWALHRSRSNARNWVRIVRRYRPGWTTTATVIVRGLSQCLIGAFSAGTGLLLFRRGQAAAGACRLAKGVGLIAGAFTRGLPRT
jgi:glycosyltransferase involved in cell wall biosynthesis